MKPLDITNPETWPTEVTQLVRDAIEPLHGDEKALHDIYQKINNHDLTDNIVRMLTNETRESLSRSLSFIAYHACRPLYINSYRRKGLLVRSDERLRYLAKECAGDIAGWNDACDAVLLDYKDPDLGGWYENTVGLSFVPFKNYANKGSYFLSDFFKKLGDMGSLCREEVLKNTKPTVLVCELPLNWVLGSQTEDDCLEDYVVELLHAIIDQVCGKERGLSNPPSIHLCIDLPPEKIIEIRVMDDSSNNSR